MKRHERSEGRQSRLCKKQIPIRSLPRQHCKESASWLPLATRKLLNTSYPAFSPSVVAVDGTTLYVNPNGTYFQETGWQDSGSGISSVEPEPAFQEGVVPASITTTSRAIPTWLSIQDLATGVQKYKLLCGSQENASTELLVHFGRYKFINSLLGRVDCDRRTQGRTLEGSASLGNKAPLGNQTLPASTVSPQTTFMTSLLGTTARTAPVQITTWSPAVAARSPTYSFPTSWPIPKTRGPAKGRTTCGAIPPTGPDTVHPRPGRTCFPQAAPAGDQRR